MGSVTVAGTRSTRLASIAQPRLLCSLPYIASVRGPTLSSVRLRTEAFVRGEYCLPQVGIQRTHMVNIILWLVVGGLIGWAASAITRTREGLMLNVVVGIVGAALAGWLVSPLVGVSTINQGNFSAPSLLVSLVGAVLLLVIVNWIRRAALR